MTAPRAQWPEDLETTELNGLWKRYIQKSTIPTLEEFKKFVGDVIDQLYNLTNDPSKILFIPIKCYPQYADTSQLIDCWNYFFTNKVKDIQYHTNRSNYRALGGLLREFEEFHSDLLTELMAEVEYEILDQHNMAENQDPNIQYVVDINSIDSLQDLQVTGIELIVELTR